MICSLMAVGATTLAATDIAGIAEIRDGEQAPAVQAPTERHREKIADFLSVAANVDLQKGPAVETDGGSGQMQRQEVGKILRGRYRGLGFGENQNPGTQHAICRSIGNLNADTINSATVRPVDCGDPSPSD